MDGQELTLRCQPRLRIKQPAGKVVALIKDIRIGGLPKRNPHLAGDRDKRTSDDTELDRIEISIDGARVGHCLSHFSSRKPGFAAEQLASGGTTMVASDCSMMAGPSVGSIVSTSLRVRICVSSQPCSGPQ